MANIWFLHTCYDQGKMRSRLLPDQEVEHNGSMVPVNLDFNTKSDRKVRSTYTLGTVFATRQVTVSKEANFYECGALYPLTNLRQNDSVPQDIADAYAEYLQRTGTAAPDPVAAPAPTPTPKISYLAALKQRSHLQPPQPEDGMWIPEHIWWPAIRNIETNVPTLLLGPTGTAKTEMVAYLAARLGRKHSTHDMGSMQDPIAALIGVHRLINGESKFDYAQFTKDIVTDTVVNLDELTRAPTGTTNVLFPLLDSRKEIQASMAGSEENRVFKRHESCVIFSTANVGSEYTGTNALDRALRNRFFLLELGYAPLPIEARLLVARSGIDKKDAVLVATVADAIRKMAATRTLAEAVSTRDTLAVADLISDGWEPIEAMKMAFLPLFDGDETTGDRLNVINAISAR